MVKTILSFISALLLIASLAYAQPGNAIHLDGANDQVVCTLPTLFSNISTNDFTFEAWVYPTGAVFSRIIYAQFSATNFATMSTGGTNQIYFYVVSNGTTYSLATTATLPGSQWTHVAARWTASTQSVAVFFNGVLQAAVPGGSSSTGTNGLMTIGTRPGGAQYFPGALDEVRVWASARSQCEIQGNMNRQFAGPQTSLVAYYNCNQGLPGGNNSTITTLIDNSGSANNGTLTNFALNGATSNWIASTAAITSVGNAANGYLQYAYPLVCWGASYTFPGAGPTVISVQGPTSYTSNLTAVNGCDSVIVTTVDAYPFNQILDTGIVCSGGSYTFPDSSTQTNITSQVIYTSTLLDVRGCDSSIVTTVDVLPSYNYAETAIVCSGGSYLFPDGTLDSNITIPVIHTSMLQTISGCDSIIETTVNVANNYFVLAQDSVCYGGSYTYPDGFVENNITAQTSHTSTFQTIFGCDSLIGTTVDLVIIDTTVSLVGNMLTTQVVGATYQWINCGNGQPISGATNASFEPTVTGDYAVILTIQGCSDTSACTNVIIIGVADVMAGVVAIYPNPNAGAFVLEISDIGLEAASVELVNLVGKVVYKNRLMAGKHGITLSDLAPGVYMMHVRTSAGEATAKVVIAR